MHATESTLRTVALCGCIECALRHAHVTHHKYAQRTVQGERETERKGMRGLSLRACVCVPLSGYRGHEGVVGTHSDIVAKTVEREREREREKEREREE